jgi:hypothetical protein
MAACHHGGWRLFNHLLAAALGRAIALAQVNGVAMCIGKHLDLDVAAVVDQALQHQRAVAKRAVRFTARAFNALLQFGTGTHQTHATPATARHGLDQ